MRSIDRQTTPIGIPRKPAEAGGSRGAELRAEAHLTANGSGETKWRPIDRKTHSL